MVIITRAVTAKPARLDDLKALATAHVEWSRTELGCLSHAMSVEAEHPNRLAFFKEWTDLAAVERR